MSNIYNMVDTWTGGTAYTAIQMNVTDISSTAGSLLLDLQVGGVSKLSVRKDGYTAGLFAFFTQYLNTPQLNFNYNAYLQSDAANEINQRNGTNWQTFNLYSTYTDASNYERLSFTQSGSNWYITPASAGTGPGTRGLTISANGVLSLGSNGGVKWNLSTSGHWYGGADNTYDIGVAGSDPRYVRAASAIVTKALTVATLPAAATAGAGARSFVTDATVTTFASTVVGGGANAVPVFSTGSAWLIG